MAYLRPQYEDFGEMPRTVYQSPTVADSPVSTLTQAVQQTAPAPAIAPAATTPSYAPGGIQIEGGGMQQLPTIMKDWISWQDATPEQWTSSGGDGGSTWMSQAARDAGYGFNENFGLIDSPFYRNTDNYEWSFNPQTGAPTVRVKSADKAGTYVTYKQDASGNWVPDYSTQNTQQWETNNNDDFYRGVGGVLLAAVGGNLAAASGALGTAAQGAWTTGLSAAEQAAAASLGLGSTAGAGAGETSFLSNALDYSNYASKGLDLAGKLTGNDTLSTIGKYTGLAGGAAGGFDNLMSGNWMDMLKGGYSLYSTGTKINNAMQAEDMQDQRLADYNQRKADYEARKAAFYGQGTPGMTTAPFAGGGTGPQVTPQMNWLDQLTRMGGGVYSDIQNREAFTNLNNLFSRMEEQRAPYEQKLRESFTNPESYLQGADYKALAGIRANELGRADAKLGRNANDVDRERLMQAHAQKALGDYRSSLMQALSQHQLPYGIFEQAQNRNARAGGPTAGGIGASGITGGIIDLLKQAGIDPSKIAGSLPQIIQSVTGGAAGGYTPNVHGSGTYGSNIPAGDPGFESDFPMSGGEWNPWDPGSDTTGGWDPTGGAWGPPEISYGGDMPFEANFPEPSFDFNSPTWIEDIDLGDWFDW